MASPRLVPVLIGVGHGDFGSRHFRAGLWPARGFMDSLTPPTINTDIPVSIHVDNIDPLRDAFTLGVNADGSPVLHDAFTKARGAMDVLFTKSSALSEADRALRGRIDSAQERRLRAGADRALSDARQSVEAALESIAQHRAKTEDDITNTLGIPAARTSVTDSQRAADVRSALRAMPKTARLDALRAALNEGDAEAVAAVLSASPLASGLTRGDLEGLRMDAERKFAPKAAALRDSMDRLREVLARAGDATERTWGRLAGRGTDPHARAEAALRNLEGSAA